MRKITSKYKQNKKRRTNQFIVGGVLIFIMLFSTLGYSFMSKEDENTKKINYNGFEFIEQNGLWFTNIGDLNFVFKYNPKQIEAVDPELKYLDNYYGKPLYIYSEDNEAEIEIYSNFNQIIQRMQYACLDEEEYFLNNKTLINELNCDEDWPTKTCEDNFIIIRENNNSNIIQEENCVFIDGSGENLTRLTDGFLFKILGIKN